MAALNYKVIGDDMQAVVLELTQGQAVKAEAGAMMFMTSGVEMDTKMEGGLFGGIKRKIAGESLFMTTFACHAASGTVAFSSPYPGKIVPLEVSGQTLLCQRDAFLCADREIELDIAFTKRLGAGFFGGEGFILERITGHGIVFLQASGAIVRKDLANGESLKVDTGCLVAFEGSVDYDIQMVGGIKTAFFGGEGLFLARLTGPGQVWLQTLPFSRLADRVISASRRSVGEVRRGRSLLGGLGDLISGD
ncbi:MAG: TIGR00266 family protein [Candidatus Coatesbacteria bacterium]|nr:MAG: TIGR00266 family protein [Candidatus Coatesbacteria bacterium]